MRKGGLNDLGRLFSKLRAIDMKVRTFTGTETTALDKQVNDWLTESKVKVRNTTTAFKRLRYYGPDAIAGKTSYRVGLALAISVWYDEPSLGPVGKSKGTSDFGKGPVPILWWK